MLLLPGERPKGRVAGQEQGADPADLLCSLAIDHSLSPLPLQPLVLPALLPSLPPPGQEDSLQPEPGQQQVDHLDTCWILLTSSCCPTISGVQKTSQLPKVIGWPGSFWMNS